MIMCEWEALFRITNNYALQWGRTPGDTDFPQMCSGLSKPGFPTDSQMHRISGSINDLTFDYPITSLSTDAVSTTSHEIFRYSSF